MPTPLFPPPTPLLSALPPPNQSISQSANHSFRGWSPIVNATPQLSSSAPAELPSFELEPSIKRSDQTTNQSNRSLLNSPLLFGKDASANHAGIPPISQSINRSNGLPLLAAALQKQQSINQTIRQSVTQSTKSTLVHSASSTLSLNQASYQSTAHSSSQLTGHSHMTHSQSFSVDSNSSTNPNELRPINTSANLSINQSTPYTTRSLNQSVKPFDNRSMARLSSITELLKVVCPDAQIHQSVGQSLNQSVNRLSLNSALDPSMDNQPFVVLDLDDTLYCQYHSPCAMMTERGLARYSELINTASDYAHLSFATKTSITRALQSAVSRKRGVEKATIPCIKALQSRGVAVVGLTARYTSMISTTRMECASLGIDLSLNSPFDAFVRDPASSAVLVDGIIFSNAQEKGPILNRFLTQLWSPYLRHTSINQSVNQSLSSPPSPPLSSLVSTPIPINTQPVNQSSSQFSHMSSSVPSTHQSITQGVNHVSPIIFRTSKRLKHKKLRFKFDDLPPSIDATHLDVKHNTSVHHSIHPRSMSPPVIGLPSKIVFIDDRLQNCVSVMNGLKIAQQLNLSLICYHYTPDRTIDHSTHQSSNPSSSESDEECMDESYDACLDESDEDECDRLAEYQIHHFINQSIVLTDREARKHRRAASPTQNQSINASPESNSCLQMMEEDSAMIGML